MAKRDINNIQKKGGDPDKVLTEMEHAYVMHRATGLNKLASARLAGYTSPGGGDALEKRPHIIEALQKEQVLYAKISDYKRKHCIDGIAEAIGRAKLKGEPMTEIAGWREIAKICGYYAPEVKKIQLSASAEKMKNEFEALSDEDLLALAAPDVHEALEGEFERVPND